MFLSITSLKRIVVSLFVVSLMACGQVKPVNLPTATRQVTWAITAMPAGTSTTPTLVQEFSTLQLIDQAYSKGEITAEYRLLYMAYALYEYESLPIRFRGNAGWRGTSTVMELHKVISTPSVLCSMSPFVRSEFQRLFDLEMSCK